MAGAWEIAEANQVLVGILHTDVTTMAWSFGLRNLIIPGDERLRRFDPFMPLAGMPFDHARDVACQRAIDCGAQWCFFMDSDVVMPRDAILRLMAHRKPLISGLYCRRSPPAAVPVMIRNGQWVINYPQGAVIEVDYVGAGCMLIHRTLLEQLPVNPERPEHRWFDWRVNLVGMVPDAVSEDFAFCLRCKRELNVPTLVDTSIMCRHIGLAESEYGRFVPCEVRTTT